MGGKSGSPVQKLGNYAKDPTTYATMGTNIAWKESGIGKNVSKSLGFDNSAQKELMEKATAERQAEYGAKQPIYSKMTKSEEKYMKSLGKDTKGYRKQRDKSIDPYLKQLDQLQGEASQQANDAKVAYSQDIQPRLRNVMDQAEKESQSAMTLAEAGDPNSRVAKSVRDLYDKQAVAEGNRGKADFGVLSALGAQSMGQQLGGMPAFTGSNLQLMQAGSQSQAGQAYANAQRRMADLRDRGLDRGFSESAAQYDRGVQARDFYNQSIGNFEGAMDRDISRQQGLRDVQQGYGADRMGIKRGVASEDYGIDRGMASERLGMDMGQYGRKLGSIADLYGGRQQDISNQIAMENADNASKRGMTGGIITAMGTIAGGAAGGKEGAQTGAMAGGSISQGMQQGTNPQYQSYQSRPAGSLR